MTKTNFLFPSDMFETGKTNLEITGDYLPNEGSGELDILITHTVEYSPTFTVVLHFTQPNGGLFIM